MRKGMGLGLGSGYKNLVTRDPFVHSMSSRGIKQASPLVILPDRYSNKNKKFAKKEQEIEKMNRVNKGEWSFDLTDFKDKESWKDFLNKHDFVLVGKMKDSRSYSFFMYQNPQGIKLLTEHDPLKGEGAFLGYVGFTYPKGNDNEFQKVVMDFREGAGYKPNKVAKMDVYQKLSDKISEGGYIKEENPHEQNYISNAWLYLSAKGMKTYSSEEIFNKVFPLGSKNFMTPRVLSYTKPKANRAVELSVGDALFDRGKLYGVTVIDIDERGNTKRRFDLSKSFHSKSAAKNYKENHKDRESYCQGNSLWSWGVSIDRCEFKSRRGV